MTSSTPVLVAEARSTPTVAVPSSPDDEASISSRALLGYSVFALMMGSLLGWLFLRMSATRAMGRRR